MAAWCTQRLGAAVGIDGVLPSIGSKELVAWLPTLLGVGAGDTVVVPELAYPTYDVGVRLAGAELVRADSTTALGPRSPALVWINSPSNPTGRVLPPEHLAKVVAWARERDAIVVSDECYIELGWETEPVSVLHPDVCHGDHHGVLAVHSLSKRSNLAGYRAGFVAGDPALIKRLLEVRKHAGMIVPAPVQAAMVAALGDQEHVAEQRANVIAGDARCCERRSAPPGSPSSSPTPASTCGRLAATTAGRPSTSSPSAGSWSRRASSTAQRAAGTYASPSPPPMSGSTRPRPG